MTNQIDLIFTPSQTDDMGLLYRTLRSRQSTLQMKTVAASKLLDLCPEGIQKKELRIDREVNESSDIFVQQVAGILHGAIEDRRASDSGYTWNGLARHQDLILWMVPRLSEPEFISTILGHIDSQPHIGLSEVGYLYGVEILKLRERLGPEYALSDKAKALLRNALGAEDLQVFLGEAPMPESKWYERLEDYLPRFLRDLFSPKEVCYFHVFCEVKNTPII